MPGGGAGTAGGAGRLAVPRPVVVCRHDASGLHVTREPPLASTPSKQAQDTKGTAEAVISECMRAASAGGAGALAAPERARSAG